jgi:hypothetical protein
VLHHAIREHSMEAGKVVKTEGKPNDLMERIRKDPLFKDVSASVRACVRACVRVVSDMDQGPSRAGDAHFSLSLSHTHTHMYIQTPQP